MERQWYLARGEQVFGPVTDAQLQQAVAAGRIVPTDLLNVAGEPNWVRASEVPGLFPNQPKPAPLPPAPATKGDLELETVDGNLIPAEVVEEVLELDSVEEPAPQLVKLRVTCMSCFREVTVKVLPGTVSEFCPKCRSPIEIAAPPAPAAPQSANQGAFAKLESKRAFKKRMLKKAADPYAESDD